jgi:simple sugar transport system permease protein
MDVGLLTALAVSMVSMATPLLLASLGEIVSERAGVINIGLEGMILVGAFVAMAVTYTSTSPYAGVGAALVAGALLGRGLAFFVVQRGANQVVAGTALNLLAAGLTGVGYRALFGVTGAALTIPALPMLPIPALSGIPAVGPAFFSHSLLVYAALLLVPITRFALHRTMLGLKLRMAGENPRAAEAQGVSVRAIRTGALVVCGALAAAAGAYLAVGYARTFVEGMSAGRGFIALAVVILGRWSPWGALAATLFFGFATALQFHFQALGLPIPYQFFLTLPYVLTILVLAASPARVRAPAALGQAYVRE